MAVHPYLGGEACGTCLDDGSTAYPRGDGRRPLARRRATRGLADAQRHAVRFLPPTGRSATGEPGPPLPSRLGSGHRRHRAADLRPPRGLRADHCAPSPGIRARPPDEHQHRGPDLHADRGAFAAGRAVHRGSAHRADLHHELAGLLEGPARLARREAFLGRPWCPAKPGPVGPRRPFRGLPGPRLRGRRAGRHRPRPADRHPAPRGPLAGRRPSRPGLKKAPLQTAGLRTVPARREPCGYGPP